MGISESKHDVNSLSPLNVDTIYSTLDNTELISNFNIPTSIINLIAQFAVCRRLQFIECGKRLQIKETELNYKNIVVITDKYGWGYSMAITNGEYSHGIHYFKVLIGPTPSTGCRYIGYVSKSNDGIIRLEEGMHSCDYWVGWDGSCKAIYSDYGGTREWDKAEEQTCAEWKQGDQILSELNCDKGILTFYKNGDKMYSITHGLKGRKWIPAVSLVNNTESVTILWSLYLG